MKERQVEINIDFTKTPLDNISLCKPMTDSNMAERLGEGWNALDVKKVNEQFGLFTDIPMMCIGKEECIFSKQCQVQDDLIDKHFLNKNCPEEVLHAFKIFSGYVKDLNISPKDFTDLQVVYDLVRLHILMRRCDLYQKLSPIYDLKSGAYNQRTGQVEKDKVINIGAELAKRTRDDINKGHTNLLASRKDKLVKQQAMGKSINNLANVMASVKAKAKALPEE